MESFEPIKREITKGEALAQRVAKAGESLHLTDYRTQVFLARAAFPGDPTAMEKWLEGEGSNGSLAERFRAFHEDPTRKPEEMYVDVTNEIALTDLVEKVRKHEPETLH